MGAKHTGLLGGSGEELLSSANAREGVSLRSSNGWGDGTWPRRTSLPGALPVWPIGLFLSVTLGRQRCFQEENGHFRSSWGRLPATLPAHRAGKTL